MYYVLQPEPEGAQRWRVLSAGASLGCILLGIALTTASHLKPRAVALEPVTVSMRIVQHPKPEPAPAPQPEASPPPTPKETQPRPAPERHNAKPPPPPTKAETSPPPSPAEPLALGITLSSTTSGGRGPRFAVGDSLMGEPDRIARAPRPKPKSRAQLTETAHKPLGRGSFAKKISVAAKLRQSVTPRYPKSAKSQGLEGVVVLAITIGPDGRVERAEVLKGLGYGLDESALNAAQRTVWSPATIDNEPVRSTRRFNVRFTLTS